MNRDLMSLVVLLLALIWGSVWALFLQCSALGRFLAMKRTWLTVVIGIGVDLCLAALIVPPAALLPIITVFALSGIPVVVRSLWNEHAEETEAFNAIKDAIGQQDHLGV